MYGCSTGGFASMPRAPERPSFFPSGAIASFLAMVVLYIGIWFALYFLMAHRG
jgi:hypothetical protein